MVWMRAMVRRSASLPVEDKEEGLISLQSQPTAPSATSTGATSLGTMLASRLQAIAHHPRSRPDDDMRLPSSSILPTAPPHHPWLGDISNSSDDRVPCQLLESLNRGFTRSGIFKLFKLPAEVRVMIYKEYFVAISNYGSSSRPQLPNLLTAVRCRPDHYRELLEAYYQDYEFILGLGSEKDFDNNVSMKLVRSMRQLRLEYGVVDNTALQEPGPRHSWRYFDVRNVYGDFHDFIESVWHNPLNTKIHQALNLRSIVVSLRLYPWGSRGLLRFVDLMHLYFSLLKNLTVYVVLAKSLAPVLSLKEEEEEFKAKKLASVVTHTYEEESNGCIMGLGLECHWLGKDGEKRCFVIEKRQKNQE